MDGRIMSEEVSLGANSFPTMVVWPVVTGERDNLRKYGQVCCGKSSMRWGCTDVGHFRQGRPDKNLQNDPLVHSGGK